MAVHGYRLLHEQGLLALYEPPVAGARMTEHLEHPLP
jgi:hypothetical protein